MIWSIVMVFVLIWANVHCASDNTTSFNALVLMVDKSLTNRFDMAHIGPAIDIAQQVFPFCLIDVGLV